MAVTFIQLATGTASTTNQSTAYNGTAGTPAAGDLLIAFIVVSGNTTIGTLSGGGFTWNVLTSAAISTTHFCSIWWAAAPTATSTTLSYLPAAAATGCILYGMVVRGARSQTSATVGQALQQAAVTANGTTANEAVTFGANTTAGNGLLLFGANSTNSTTQWTAPTGFTELTELAYNTPATSGQVSQLSSVVTPATTYTWTNANTSAWRTFGLEFAAAPATSFDPMGMLGIFGI
jgi:hypothetical protein